MTRLPKARALYAAERVESELADKDDEVEVDTYARPAA